MAKKPKKNRFFTKKKTQKQLKNKKKKKPKIGRTIHRLSVVQKTKKPEKLLKNDNLKF